MTSHTHRPEGLEDVFAQMRAARGQKADEDWALDVAGAFLLEGAGESATRRHLNRAAEAVRRTGEGPAALYGGPRAFVAQVRAEAAETGEPLVDSTPDAAWRDVPAIGFALAAGISVLFAVVWLVRDGPTTTYTWGLLLAPALLGLLGTGLMALWERMLLRTSRLAAVAATAAVFLAVAGPLAWWLVEVNADTELFTGSTFWLFALVPACAALAWLSAKAAGTPARRRRDRPGGGTAEDAAPDDEAWARGLAGILRLRMDLPEQRIREIVAEAQAHSTESGRPLAEEFGTPESYAARFRPDEAAKARRAAWGSTALVALLLLMQVMDLAEDGELSAWRIALSVAMVIVLVGVWRTARAAARGRTRREGAR